MSQQLGASRMGTQFSAGDYADERLQNMLALYKSPATIRDMKQVFFYVDALAAMTQLAPLTNFYNLTSFNNLISKMDVNLSPYFDLIGTTRTFNIADKVNDLLDIRVPQDKYVFEINLVECGIDTDPTNWTTIPDTIVAKNLYDGNDWKEYPTYRLSTETEPDGVAGFPPRTKFTNKMNIATKLTTPQTLFCRIKQLSNGEPYNWSITNSGSGYSIDKSHQLLVRHGDINEVKLDLEFGHLVFTGSDFDNYAEVKSQRDGKSFAQVYDTLLGNPIPQQLDDKQYYRQYKYIDYNREVYNHITSGFGSVSDQTGVDVTTYLDENVANFYKGDGGIDTKIPYTYGTTISGVPPEDLKLIPAKNLERYANRPAWFYQDVDPALGVDRAIVVQGKPLFYNQQVSRLSFRFMVRIIHMF